VACASTPGQAPEESLTGLRAHLRASEDAVKYDVVDLVEVPVRPRLPHRRVARAGLDQGRGGGRDVGDRGDRDPDSGPQGTLREAENTRPSGSPGDQATHQRFCAPGRIRTCDARFRNRCDHVRTAFYLVLWLPAGAPEWLQLRCCAAVRATYGATAAGRAVGGHWPVVGLQHRHASLAGGEATPGRLGRIDQGVRIARAH
jgi:hypothetical protein